MQYLRKQNQNYKTKFRAVPTYRKLDIFCPFFALRQKLYVLHDFGIFFRTLEQFYGQNLTEKVQFR